MITTLESIGPSESLHVRTLYGMLRNLGGTSHGSSAKYLGAQILGPSTIGAYGSAAQPTQIGPGALIDSAIIEPGAIVSALARVGPGVTVPSGLRVLPSANLTTNAEASNPALGKVTRVTSTDLSTLNSQLTANLNLAYGSAQLDQGQSATGPSPGVSASVTTVFNSSLAPAEGAGPEPGSATASTTHLPAGTAPRFPSPNLGLVPANSVQFRARVTGAVTFNSLASDVAHHLGRSNAIRADLDQGHRIKPGVFHKIGKCARNG